jgi:putative transposase
MSLYDVPLSAPTVLRYVERKARRANLVARAEDWRWCSATPGISDSLILDPGPVVRPANWLQYVNQPQTEAELERLRDSIRRGRPFGDDSWMARTAAALGLEGSLRPRGRPRKAEETQASLFDEADGE